MGEKQSHEIRGSSIHLQAGHVRRGTGVAHPSSPSGHMVGKRVILICLTVLIVWQPGGEKYWNFFHLWFLFFPLSKIISRWASSFKTDFMAYSTDNMMAWVKTLAFNLFSICDIHVIRLIIFPGTKARYFWNKPRRRWARRETSSWARSWPMRPRLSMNGLSVGSWRRTCFFISPLPTLKRRGWNIRKFIRYEQVLDVNRKQTNEMMS